MCIFRSLKKANSNHSDKISKKNRQYFTEPFSTYLACKNTPVYFGLGLFVLLSQWLPTAVSYGFKGLYIFCIEG